MAVHEKLTWHLGTQIRKNYWKMTAIYAVRLFAGIFSAALLCLVGVHYG